MGEREQMTDKEIVIHFLNEIGIKYNVTNDGIWIDSETVDGCTHNLFVKFYSDYNDRYQKIEVYEA